MKTPTRASRLLGSERRGASLHLILVVALMLGWCFAAGSRLAAGPPTSPQQQVDPFYLKMLDSGERSVRAGAFTAATRDLEIAVFGLGREPRLAGKAYLLLAVCRDAMLDKDRSRSNLLTASGLLGPEGAAGLGLDERTLAVVRTLVESYKVALALPAPPVTKTEPKPAAPAPAPKVEKPAPETKKVPQEKKKEDAGKPEERETRPAAKRPEAEKKQAPAKVEAPPPAKAPAKTETSPRKKDTTPPSQVAARIEGPKPVFHAPGESLPDVLELEKKLASDPANAALVHEIVPRYFERKDYKAARRVLEGLRAKRPLDLRDRLLLARTDFFLKDYATSLQELRAISDPSSRVRPGPDESRTISIYTAFCLAYLDQIKSAASILDPLRTSLGPERFSALIEAEGLTAQWGVISPRFKN